MKLQTVDPAVLPNRCTYRSASTGLPPRTASRLAAPKSSPISAACFCVPCLPSLPKDTLASSGSLIHPSPTQPRNRHDGFRGCQMTSSICRGRSSGRPEGKASGKLGGEKGDGRLKTSRALSLRSAPGSSSLEVLLPADAVSFAEPDEHFGVHVPGRLNAEIMDVIARGERLDFREAGILHSSRQNHIRVQPIPSQHDIGKRHAHLKRDPRFVGKHDHSPASPNQL